MATKSTNIPQYGTTMRGNIQYYRTRILDADGKQVALYATTPEELYKKERKARREVAEIIFRNNNPTVEDYCEKWLLMKSATISASTLKNYTNAVNKYIVAPLGNMYLSEVTTDDLLLALAPVSNMSKHMYDQVNMLLKCIFASAENTNLINYNPAVKVPASGGKPAKKKEVLTDEQMKILLDAVRGLPPYPFIMIGLYSGLRREEILALQWDCVFLDEPTPYISVKRAWRPLNGKAEISTVLKSKAAKRDIPIPKCLVNCLHDVKANSKSDFVIANSNGEPLSESQFRNLWNYVDTRTAKEKTYYRYVNGRPIKCTLDLPLGSHPKNNHSVVRSINFDVTPHQLRHTYITNLLYAGVDPKTVQYLAGHENSKTTMDIYAQIKYNQPEQLYGVVSAAFSKTKKV